MTHVDPPVLTGDEIAMTPAEALGAAVTREYLTLMRNAEVQAARSGLLTPGQTAAGLADELLSDALTKAMPRAERWNPDTLAWPWIAAFVANSIRDRIRERKQRRARIDEHTSTDQDERHDGASVMIDPKSLAPDHLFELLELVPEPHQSLLRMAEVDRLTGGEIAQALGISHGSVRVRLMRARRKLSEEYLIAQQGGRS